MNLILILILFTPLSIYAFDPNPVIQKINIETKSCSPTENQSETFSFSSCDKPNLYFQGKNKNFTPRELFSQTLSIGASVSNGYPGSYAGEDLVPAAERLQSRFGGNKTLKRSYPHQDSKVIMANYLAEKNQKENENASVVVAMDLFYWDADPRKNPDCKVDQILETITKLNSKPLILGNIPLKGTNSDCALKINDELKVHCTLANNCHSVDIASAFSRLKLDQKKLYFQNDEQHLTNLGYQFMENQICNQVFKN